MVIAPARRAGDPGSIPGPGENFSLKLLINDLSEGYSKTKILSEVKDHPANTRMICGQHVKSPSHCWFCRSG